MMRDLVGQTLRGRYSIVREIGRGGMGAVYEAIQLDLGRRVAVKVLLGAETRAVQRFRQEALASASIQHPNIVSVTDFDAGDADSPPFLVMELLEGCSLASYLALHRQLEPSRAALIAAQMLDGLGAAHAAGIIHRDVKPRNVFLVDIAGGQIVKILDFGIAKLLEDDHGVRTTTGTFVGTPAYVAPEQALAGVIDARTDIHAVSLCLYEMLVGARAFTAPDTTTLLAQIMRTEAPPIRVPGVPPELAAVVKRGLEKDQNLRFATTSAMREALRPFMPGSAMVPMAPHVPAATASPKRSWVPLLLGLGLTVAIGVIVIGVFVMAARSSEGSQTTAVDAAAPQPSVTGVAYTPEAPTASTSARAQSTAVAPPTRTPNITPTATPSALTPTATGSTVRLVSVVNIERARADGWFQQNEPALRASCLRTRTCFRTVTMPAEGANGVSVPQAVQPEGCTRSTASCIASFVSTHPYPAPACRDAGRCSSSMTFSFD